eukprot:TRINITY_DN111514_c0_g1_i1.p1 TRINITY_DN111514_c0_g1~~TRINITY_DN111514_c0_g1_i1.p1  ORF type:complete len:292 (+),score=26.46 TRINITY_DN111514_c0_g1_i1:49-924(+)
MFPQLCESVIHQILVLLSPKEVFAVIKTSQKGRWLAEMPGIHQPLHLTPEETQWLMKWMSARGRGVEGLPVGAYNLMVMDESILDVFIELPSEEEYSPELQLELAEMKTKVQNDLSRGWGVSLMTQRKVGKLRATLCGLRAKRMSEARFFEPWQEVVHWLSTASIFPRVQRMTVIGVPQSKVERALHLRHAPVEEVAHIVPEDHVVDHPLLDVWIPQVIWRTGALRNSRAYFRWARGGDQRFEVSLAVTEGLDEDAIEAILRCVRRLLLEGVPRKSVPDLIQCLVSRVRRL